MSTHSPRYPTRHGSRRGFTLVELLTVITIAGLLMAMAYPKFGPMRDMGGVRSSKQAITSYLATARQAAIRRGQPATFHVSGNTVWVSMNGGTEIIEPQKDLMGTSSVTVTTALTTVTYNPRGLARLGPDRRITLARGVASDTVCVSLLGAIGKCGL